HALVPPHPGPVAAADLLGANIGLLVFTGILIALPTWYFGGYLFGLWAGRRFHLNLPASFLTGVERDTRVAPPTFPLVMTILLMPLVLIFLDTGLNTLSVMGVVDGNSNWVQLLRMIGKTPVALLITVLFALAAFSGRHSRKHLEKVCDGALGPI